LTKLIIKSILSTKIFSFLIIVLKTGVSALLRIALNTSKVKKLCFIDKPFICRKPLGSIDVTYRFFS